MAVAVDSINCPVEEKVKLSFLTEGREVNLMLKNVLYSSRLFHNLMVGPLIDEAKGSFICKNGKITVYGKNSMKLFHANKRWQLCYLSKIS